MNTNDRLKKIGISLLKYSWLKMSVGIEALEGEEMGGGDRERRLKELPKV